MAQVVGSWFVTTDWGCNGSISGTFKQNFKKDGTWTLTPSGHSGRWYQVECLVVWTVTDMPTLVYVGNLSGSWMAGVQGDATPGGSKGCFGARRAAIPASKLKVTPKKTKGIDPVTGR
jgi:hypothetical protein